MCRSTRDGAPAVSRGASVSSLAAETQTRFTLLSASAWKSTGNRTSMPRSPRLHCTSSGKLLLQYMKEPFRSHIISGLNYTALTPKTITSPSQLAKVLEVQEKQGYSTEFEETTLGISSIAAPIFSTDGTFFGTLSATAFSGLLEANTDTVVPQLLQAAARIQEGLSAL